MSYSHSVLLFFTRNAYHRDVGSCKQHPDILLVVISYTDQIRWLCMYCFPSYTLNFSVSSFYLLAMRSDRTLHLSISQLCSHVNLEDNSQIHAYSLKLIYKTYIILTWRMCIPLIIISSWGYLKRQVRVLCKNLTQCLVSLYSFLLTLRSSLFHM